MDEALRKQWPMKEQDQRISEAIARDESRLRNFIRKRVAEPGDVEDILQDVFYELVEAYRMLKPSSRSQYGCSALLVIGSSTFFARESSRG